MRASYDPAYPQIPIVRLCPRSNWKMFCEDQRCERRDAKCFCTNRPWIPVCVIPPDHPVMMVQMGPIDPMARH